MYKSQSPSLLGSDDDDTGRKKRVKHLFFVYNISSVICLLFCVEAQKGKEKEEEKATPVELRVRQLR